MPSPQLLPETPSPRVGMPGPDGLARAMKDVLSVESDFVAKFLPLHGMTRPPAGFPAFAQWHFGQLGEPVCWEDAAPAYALACLSHAAYGGSFDPSVEWELELQWADLAPLSRLDWPLARQLVMAAWSYLSGDEALPRDFAAAFDDDTASMSSLRLDLELVPAFGVLRESMARLDPAQWHTRGQERWLPTDVPALSLAASPALALVDALTLYGFAEDEPRLLVRLAFAPHLLRTLENAAGDPSPLALARQRREASHWASERDSVLLQVPSQACPGEFNLLANPRHPDFSRLQRFDARPLQLDRRRHRH